MTDIALVFKDLQFDIEIKGNDLVGDDGLETAVSISLFTDQRVSDEELPLGAFDKRGWWGDMFAEFDQDQIGSKLWTVQREKVLNEVLRKHEDYCREALQWMIDDLIASAINVISSYNGKKELVSEIEIVKPTTANQRYEVNWNAQEIKRMA